VEREGLACFWVEGLRPDSGLDFQLLLKYTNSEMKATFTKLRN
jgi:hypothetical protein